MLLVAIFSLLNQKLIKLIKVTQQWLTIIYFAKVMCAMVSCSSGPLWRPIDSARTSYTMDRWTCGRKGATSTTMADVSRTYIHAREFVYIFFFFLSSYSRARLYIRSVPIWNVFFLFYYSQKIIFCLLCFCDRHPSSGIPRKTSSTLSNPPGYALLIHSALLMALLKYALKCRAAIGYGLVY